MTEHIWQLTAHSLVHTQNSPPRNRWEEDKKGGEVLLKSGLRGPAASIIQHFKRWYNSGISPVWYCLTLWKALLQTWFHKLLFQCENNFVVTHLRVLKHILRGEIKLMEDCTQILLNRQPVSSIKPASSMRHINCFCAFCVLAHFYSFCSTSYPFICPTPYVDKVECLCYFIWELWQWQLSHSWWVGTAWLDRGAYPD